MNNKLINIIFKCIGLSIWIASAVLSLLKIIDTKTATTLTGIGLMAIGISQFNLKR